MDSIWRIHFSGLDILSNYAKMLRLCSPVCISSFIQRTRSLHVIKSCSEERIHLVHQNALPHSLVFGLVGCFPKGRSLHGPQNPDGTCWEFLTLESTVQLLHFHIGSNQRHHYFMDSKVHPDLRNKKNIYILEMIGYGKHIHYYLILEYLNNRKNSVAV